MDNIIGLNLLVKPRNLFCECNTTQYNIDSNLTRNPVQIFAAALNRAFGPDNFSVNFGLIWTSALWFQVLLIVITQIDFLYEAVGDTGMFVFAGVVSAAGAGLTLFVPEDMQQDRTKKKILLS